MSGFVDLFLCRWDDFSGQEAKIVVRAPHFFIRVTIPGGGHVVVPVQIAGSHQCEQRVAGSLCGLVYLLALGEEGVTEG